MQPQHTLVLLGSVVLRVQSVWITAAAERGKPTQSKNGWDAVEICRTR